MRRSTDRILTSHAGVLPRPPALLEAFRGGDDAADKYEALLPESVAEIVADQIAVGMDQVNDGELPKRGWNAYIRERVAGIERGEWAVGEKPDRAPVNGRDRRRFPEFYATGAGSTQLGSDPYQGSAYFVTGPLSYVGGAKVAEDCARLRAATEGLEVDPWLPAVAPGAVEHWLYNRYYESDEAFLFALADVLHDEYKAITDAGVIVQVDDPDLPDGWQMFPDWDLARYREYARLRVEATNHALRDIPEEMVRFHICWGSQHGPHADDIGLAEIIDLVLDVKAQCYNIEASNGQHEHEWTVFRDVKLPDGKILMPGVVGHSSDIVEHPDTVAQRLVRYANLVGKENLMAGTDCGLGTPTRIGSGDICWGKLANLAEGARRASDELWS